MSGISSGTGLISGLPTSQIIDSLMQLASRPKTLLSQRLGTIQTQRTSLSELSARLLALKTTVGRLKDASFFKHFNSTSSNEDVVTAVASESAAAGTVSLQVKTLVTSHQLISTGFATSDESPVGVGRISVELGNGLLERRTALGDLNGGAGVRRGVIRITDRAGHAANIDLTAAVDMRDVLDAINGADDLQVRARVDGGHLVLDDQSGGAGTLTIAEVRGGNTANDLGILQSASGATLVGSEIHYLTDATDLKRLNDGNGIRHATGLDDFKITNGAGTSFNVRLDGTLSDSTRLAVLNNGNGVRLGTVRITNRLGLSGTVDLSAATTIGDVRLALSAAKDDNGTSLNVTASIRAIGGVGSMTLTDASVIPKDETTTDETDDDADKQKRTLSVTDVTGFAARDLGISQSVESATISGAGIHRIATVGDVIRAINYAQGNDGTVVASLTGNGLHLEDSSGGAGLTVEALTDGHGGLSKGAIDLGIEGTHGSSVDTHQLLAGLNTVLLKSLNGGSGLQMGSIAFTTRAGQSVTVDFTGAQTMQDIINRINTQVPGITADINSIGHGLALTDTSGGSGALGVADVQGNLAATLGLAGTFAKGSVSGQNLQLQYFNERTEVSGLNGGRGVQQGTMEFRTSTGTFFSVEIDAGDTTLGDVINAINDKGRDVGIVAGINATGDGIVVRDTNGGTQRLRIRDLDDGSAATDLRIAGEAEVGSTQLDGSFEFHVDVQAGDTLATVAAKIRDLSPDLNATVLNDGASAAAYRLSVASGLTGRRGQLLFDAGSTALGMSTLVAARDAVVLIGGQDSTSPIVVSSASNTLRDVVPGVELNLHSVSNEAVTISTGRDIDQVTDDLQKFVDDYNAVLQRIDAATSFDPETEKKGPLLGDSTVATVENRLSRTLLTRTTSAPAGFQTLASMGITIGDAGRLSFDEDVFRERFAKDPNAVRTLFSGGDNSIGAVLDQALEDLTSSTDGVMTNRDKALSSQVDDINDRIADMDVRLSRKREQLERQYANLETVLAGMQSQQSALSTLASISIK
jgi:flagellar hook-associated protein 2